MLSATEVGRGGLRLAYPRRERGDTDSLAMSTDGLMKPDQIESVASRRPRADDDLLIGSFARVHEATVVTRNTQDFEGLGLSLEDWTQPP